MADYRSLPAVRPTRRALLALVASSALVLAPARGQTPQEPLPIGAEWQAERLREEAVAPPGTTIRVENAHGDLRARRVDGRSVELAAVAQTRVGDPERPELRLVEGQGILTIVAAFAASDDPRVAEYEAMDPRRRIDLVVSVPDGCPLSAATDGGLLEVKGVAADLTLETVSGAIVARSPGSIRARSDRGSVYVALQGTRWPVPPAVETVSGPIRLEVPPSADARVVLLTAAEITTDFSVEIDHPEPGRRKRAVALLGRGSPEIAVTSQVGDVKLLEYPYPPADTTFEDHPERGSETPSENEGPTTQDPDKEVP